MSADDLGSIVGEKLRLLAGEMFAREGYHVADNPDNTNIDILVTNPSNKGTKAFFVNIAGRESLNSLTKRDIENAVSKNFEAPESTLVLIITTKRSATSSARKEFANTEADKDIWYADDTLSYLRGNYSAYLVDIYDNNMHNYSKPDELESRLEYQGISVSNRVTEYICEESYHPRKLIAYVELLFRDEELDIFSTRAVKKFKAETNIDSYL